MKFGKTRNAALKFWLQETNRLRVGLDDRYENSFECNWQLGFKPPDANNKDHYSIFCSMGDWNSLITDFLDDGRYDDLDFRSPENQVVLFRNYTKIFLVFSEIMTDFQDVLTIYRLETLVAANDIRKENSVSRNQLEKYSPSPGYIQTWFDFINKICKHKSKNIHSCNHHIFYWFEDEGSALISKRTISITNVKAYMDGKLGYMADTVVVPSLKSLLITVVSGYRILDETFKADNKKFETFRNLYKGVALQ